MTVLFMRSACRLNTDVGRLLLVLVIPATLAAQLPDGPGKAETVKLCGQCHEVERSISLRQDREGWQTTLNKMTGLGAKFPDKEAAIVVEYLAKHFPGDERPRINVNKAAAIELESGLSLRRSQAAAILQYREKNGPFKSLDDLKKVPGIDPAQLDSKKDRLTF